MRTFKLTIATFDKVFYDGFAVSCTVSTPSGRIGFEAFHEPFLAVLKDNSEIKYTDPNRNEKTLQVRSGLLSFKQNICMLAVG